MRGHLLTVSLWTTATALLAVLGLLVACQGGDQPEAGQGIAPVPSSGATSTAPTPGLANPTVVPTPASSTPQPAPSPDSPQIDLCEAGRAQNAGVARVSADAGAAMPHLLRADSWIAYDGIAALSWASTWIVEAEVGQRCDDADAGVFPTYAVKVSRTFRGEPQDVMTVTGVGDRYGSRPPLEAGDRLVLFFSGNTPGDRTLWSTGGPQGTWYLEDGLAAAEYGQLSLPVDELARSIALALEQEPPAGLPSPAITLEDAPRGPDLPGSSQAVAGCGGVLTPVAFQGRETLRLLWSSHHVFVGTVIEQLPSFQLTEPSIESDSLLRPVVTDYIVRVEHPVRGVSVERLRVRRLGGEIDGCAVQNAEGQLLVPGQRALFFLWSPDPAASDPIFYLNGSADGFWRFVDEETLVVRDATGYAATVALPTGSFLAGLRTALTTTPVEYDGFGQVPVPLDVAPVASAPDWPPFIPDPTLNWEPYEYSPFGLQLELPEGWVVVEFPDQRVISLASFATEGGDSETFPAGGVRIDIRLQESPFFHSYTPFNVGRESYPGATDIFPGVMGDTYHAYVIYTAAGHAWSIGAIFKEPIELENSGLRIYLSILQSILHRSDF